MPPRISRRQFLGGAAIAATAGATSLGCFWNRSQRRNVIVVISDSMRRDALGCYGGSWIQTPHIDAFARTAVRFDNAYVSTFPTVPARNDIFTGTYTFTYRLWGPLPGNAYTLQDALRDNKVATALVADTPHPYTEKFNFQRGFGSVDLVHGQEDDPLVTNPAVPIHYTCDTSKIRFRWILDQYLRNVSVRKSEEDWFSPQSMTRAAAWLEHNAGKKSPFFLLVDTFDPHEPWDPPQHYVELYDPGYTGQTVIYPRYDRWRDFLTEAEMRHCRALYAGEATMVDHWFGRLMDKVESLGLLEDTMIVFLSDHGFRLGERGYIGKTVIHNEAEGPQNFPLYPEIARIPLLVYYPGCKAGSSVQALAQPVNLPATVVDYMGFRVPPSFEAPSLWPVLQGKEERTTDFVISAPTLSFPRLPKDPPGGRPPRATDQPTITDGTWLLVYACAGWGDELYKHPHDPKYTERRVAYYTGHRLAPELYDLRSDPDCLHNVYQANKPIAQALHGKFFNFLSKSRMAVQRPDHLAYFSQLENT